ncbi:hypothetical protein DEO72_LG3g2364 [Vigna unguiculata]|uniref:Uncharacterized protein n=1 Tax=Vigna unguiculata TaxID=3917 RepID=A0A4D6LI53_VIGUN|nr:hypothetical protein DEO72_LG3g2364 [Vigna unguiculata]
MSGVMGVSDPRYNNITRVGRSDFVDCVIGGWFLEGPSVKCEFYCLLLDLGFVLGGEDNAQFDDMGEENDEFEGENEGEDNIEFKGEGKVMVMLSLMMRVKVRVMRMLIVMVMVMVRVKVRLGVGLSLR